MRRILAMFKPKPSKLDIALTAFYAECARPLEYVPPSNQGTNPWIEQDETRAKPASDGQTIADESSEPKHPGATNYEL